MRPRRACRVGVLVAGLSVVAVVGCSDRDSGQAGDGVVWAGTRGGGVARFAGGEWTSYTTEDGLAHDKVLSVAVDDQGVVWAGTAGGLSRLTRYSD